MSEAQAREANAAPPVPFPAAHLSRIVVGTFRLSRGNETSQQPLLAYMATNYGEQIKDADQDLASSLTLKAAIDMIGSPLHPTYSDGDPLVDYVVDSVELAYDLLRDLIDGRKSLSAAPPTLLMALIRADSRWRPSVPRPRESDETYRPSAFRSNVVRHLILGVPTNVREVDLMLGAAGQALDERTVDDSAAIDRALKMTLPMVIREHLEFHEGDRPAINANLANRQYLGQIGGQTEY